MRLAVIKKPYFEAIAPRVGLGYRRNQGAGTWVARGADGHGGYWTKGIGIADDHEDADGNSVLTFWQAQDKARQLVRGNAAGERPITVAEALENFAADLKARSGHVENATRILRLLPSSLARKAVVAVGARELRHWRDSLLSRMKRSSADRTAKMLKAALNLAARDDPRIANTNAWKTGLARLPEEAPPANKIVSDQVVRFIVAAAYEIDEHFGLLIETAAVTGARPSQLLRLEVADLHQDGSQPKLSMPSSRKGRNRHITRHPVPIPAALAKALGRRVRQRKPSEPIFTKPSGEPYGEQDHVYWFRKIVERLQLEADVTFYSLRHSSIVRQIIAGVPTRVVAAHHDTSVAVLEHTYSRHIGSVSDAVVRGALIDVGK